VPAGSGGCGYARARALTHSHFAVVQICVFARAQASAPPASDEGGRVWRRRRRHRRAAAALPLPAALEEPVRSAPDALTLLRTGGAAGAAGGGADSGSDSDLAPAALFDAAAAVHTRIHGLFAQLQAHRAAAGLPPAPTRPSFLHLASGDGGRGGAGAHAAGAQHHGGANGGPVGTRGAGGAGSPPGMSSRRAAAAAAEAQPPPPPPRRERTVHDFDISDVVGALGGGPKVVERAPHVDIATPGVRRAQPAPWELPDPRAAAAAAAAAATAAEKAEKAKRKAAAAAAAAGEERPGSSSEDTGDEAYAARHTPLEALEKKLRFGPAVPGRGSGAVARGQQQAGAVAGALPGAPSGGLQPGGALEGSVAQTATEKPGGGGGGGGAAGAATPGAPSCAVAAEWSVGRPEGPRRAHVLVIKRAETV
jgi:hypothetical protein